MRDLLVVEPDPGAPVGWFDDWLSEAGVRLEIVRPHTGDAVPAEVDRDGLLVLGGRIGAYDDAGYPWLTDIKRLLRAYTDRGAPVLGICLGHQLLAIATGGAVGRNLDGWQLGVLEVGLTAAAAPDPLFGGLSGPVRAVHWNYDVVTRPPEGAVVVAISGDGSGAGRLQAFRTGAASWGVQFHPEIGGACATEWAGWPAWPDQPDRSCDVLAAAVATAVTADDELRATWSALAYRFADIVARSRRGLTVQADATRPPPDDRTGRSSLRRSGDLER